MLEQPQCQDDFSHGELSLNGEMIIVFDEQPTESVEIAETAPA